MLLYRPPPLHLCPYSWYYCFGADNGKTNTISRRRSKGIVEAIDKIMPGIIRSHASARWNEHHFRKKVSKLLSAERN
jgi:hypothetical protein